MTIDRFTKEEFRVALDGIFNAKGNGSKFIILYEFCQREWVFYVNIVDTNKRLVVRSSIDRSGRAADTGEDSIRVWVEYFHKKADKWHPLGKDSKFWTTRQPGWRERLASRLRDAYTLAMADERAYRARHPRGVKDDSRNESEKSKEPMSSTPQGDAGERSLFKLSGRSERIEPVDSEVADERKVANERKVTDKPAAALAPNAEQLEAITAPVDAAVVVLAGPGTGKTFVISHRYAHLAEHGVAPSSILAVTFSSSMAADLLKRIVRVNPSVEGTAAVNQISTIHAACLRILRAEGDQRKVAAGRDGWRVKAAIQEIAEDLWPIAERRPGWREIAAWIDGAKTKGLTSADDLSFFNNCIDKFGLNVGSELHEARRRFDLTMRRQNFLTFADQLLDVEVKLNRDPDFRAKWQAKFTHVIVDEGQDTSAQSMRILTALAAPQDNFFIVGDADQLLFRFAGATPELNLWEGFESRYPEGQLVKLVVNYRSTCNIVRTQLELISHNYQSMGGPYEDRYLKELRAHKDAAEGEPVTFTSYVTPEDEAVAVAANILESLANGREPGHFFVGARTRAQLGYVESAMIRAELPYINAAGGSFWTLKHVADVLAYLRLAFDEGNRDAFSRVYNIASNYMIMPWAKSPQYGEYIKHRFLGKQFLEACKYNYRNVWSAVNQRGSWAPGVGDLTSLVQSIQAELANGELADVIDHIVSECYEKWLKAEEGIVSGDESQDGKLVDLAVLSELAREFGRDAAAFFAHVDSSIKAAQAKDEKKMEDYIVLSTIHRLKGLEREIVYGIGLCEGYNVKSNMPAGLLPHTFSMTPPPQDGILPTGGMGRVEDERCCAFVLVSRAKEECHLSACERYRWSALSPSRFVGEMELRDSRYVEDLVVETGQEG